MNTTQQIIKTLSTMGAKPTAKTDGTGNTIIKVNAPTPTEDKK
jgi:hypothetical protein